MMGDENINPYPDLPTRPYKVGDVVFANAVITSHWQDEYDEATYIVAVYGQIGVVCNVHEDGKLTVNFVSTGEHVVLAEDINPYQGQVVQR